MLAPAGAFHVQHGRDLHRQAEQLDETFRIPLVVNIFLAEGSIVFAVEAVGRLPADERDVALVQAQPGRAGDMLLRDVDDAVASRMKDALEETAGRACVPDRSSATCANSSPTAAPTRRPRISAASSKRPARWR